MLNIKKILLPVDFPNTSLRVIHEAATLAHHFHSEIVMLHVPTAQSHAAGVPEGGPELAVGICSRRSSKRPRKTWTSLSGPQLDGLTIQRLLVKGDAAQAIVQTAQEEKADLIMMPSHGYTFYQFLLGSVTAKVLHGSECPVWTDAHVEELARAGVCDPQHPVRGRFQPPQIASRVSWAAQMAAEFGARLTLAHVTAGVEFWGPGGSYVNPGVERGACQRRFSAYRRAPARDGHQGRRIYR